MKSTTLKIEFERETEADLLEIISVVSVATAIDQDVGLQAELRRVAQTEPDAALYLDLSVVDARLVILPSGSVEANRDLQAPSLNLIKLTELNPALNARLAMTGRKIAASVDKLLDTALNPSRPLSRPEFLALQKWGPLIERAAYRFVTRGTSLLEAWRGAALADAAQPRPPKRDSALSRYFVLLHGMAQLLLVTSSPASRQWRIEMAKSFKWVEWTPTIALVRERTLWLAAAAMRSAADFGPEVAPLYMEALNRAGHPVKVFDALLGLVSIASTAPETHDEILADILRAWERTNAKGAAHLGYSAAAFKSAVSALAMGAAEGRNRPIFRELGWQTLGPKGLCTEAAFRADPTARTADGEMLGLLVAPPILQIPPSMHFRSHVTSNSTLLPRGPELKDILLNAWQPQGTSPTLH